ncbi:hypothetical protein AH810_004373 [Salmonella enterica subsp. enterica]|nr:hypothetical protein [Salmonella enterica subsp. enterica]
MDKPGGRVSLSHLGMGGVTTNSDTERTFIYVIPELEQSPERLFSAHKKAALKDCYKHFCFTSWLPTQFILLESVDK